eukprot:SAG31_NODE_307_length_17957_cov_5.236645_10_plen_317_part_00
MPPPRPPSPPMPKAARCGRVAENHNLALGCPSGKKIDKIVYASFGTSTGSCSAGFKDGICSKTGKIGGQQQVPFVFCVFWTACEISVCVCPLIGSSNQSVPVVEEACIGKASCVVPAKNADFGNPKKDDPCPMVVKSLAAEVHCSGDPAGATCGGSCYDFAPPPPSPGPPPTPGTYTYPKISGGKQQFEYHSLRAGNTNALETRFCWHGFQYVRVTPGGKTGFTGALDAIVGLAIHTNMTATGTLKFGGMGDPNAEEAAEVLTHINQMTLQSQRTNVAAYMPTDCPTRESSFTSVLSSPNSVHCLHSGDMIQRDMI